MAPKATRTAEVVRTFGAGRSPRHGRRWLLTAARFAGATAVSTVALAALTCAAQTPPIDSDIDLLQPGLQGDPNTQPRFRTAQDAPASDTDEPPVPGAFTLPGAGVAPPTYGSPTGFGAGDTGFDSNNTPHRKRAKPVSPDTMTVIAPPNLTFTQAPDVAPEAPATPPPPVPLPLPPEIYPKAAAARPGAALPAPNQPLPINNPPPIVYPLAAASRPGGSLPVPVEVPVDLEESASTPPPGTPPLNTLPLGTPSRLPPIGGADPYEQLGIKAGSFLILPAVELSTASDTNPQHTPGGGGSLYFVVAPELHVRSDWATNSLTADVTGTYTDYATRYTPSLNRPYLNSKIDGTVDVSRDTQVILENRVIVATDNPGSPNITAGLASLPLNTTVGGTLGVIQTFNRLSVSLKGTVDRSTYDDSELTNGESTTNIDRNYNQYAAIARVSYEIDPAMKPFVEMSEDERIHDWQFDRNDQQRDSDGTSVKVGADVNLFGSLTGEIAVGFLERFYIAPLPDISGVTLDGSLIWQVTGLTTAKLTAASSVGESLLENVSGELSRDVNLEVDHALRRWLIATAIVGYGRDEYQGLGRDDNRYFVSAGLTYIFNRYMQLKGVVREDWLTSNVSGVSYNETTFLLDFRLQR